MRVLAITGNASLVVALGSMMREWEVVTVRAVDDVGDAGFSSTVALIDAGDTDRGLEAADQLYQRGITIPCLVIGNLEQAHPRATVLVRPFSLEDLSAAVADVATHRTIPTDEAPDETPVTAARPTPPPTPKPVYGRGPARPAVAPTLSETEEAAPTRRAALSVVRPEPESVETAPATEAESAIEEQPPLIEEQPDEPMQVAAPAPPPTPSVSRPVASATPGAASSAAGLEPQSWWRLRRKQRRVTGVQPTESPMVARLLAATVHLRELDALLQELPVLQDLRALADALAGELETAFAAQVASVFVRGENGYHAVAHRGLSRVEAGMVVPDTQPLISDVLRTLEGILIQPVDLAQGLVAGIGGARTEALMAAPAVLEGECVAIVVVGGDRFDETDLDRLSDLAGEAAPGLSVAHLLQMLRGRSKL